MQSPSHTLTVNGVDLVADLSGALWWPAQASLIVADLHLEKGSGFASRGVPLPPYDTAATLQRLDAVLQRYPAARVVCLGDSFHDGGAATRIGASDVAQLRRLIDGRDWIWIVGNHDPEPPRDWGGRVEHTLTLSALSFRHEARRGGRADPAAGEVSGHFHPKASVLTNAGRVTGRCFASDGRRLILPAFGAFTGGLNVLDPAVARLFRRGFTALLLGRQRLFAFPHHRLQPDPPRHRL